MKNPTIKIGDTFITKNAGNSHGDEIIIINKVFEGHKADGYGYWTIPSLKKGRKNFRARVWWLQEWCIKIDSPTDFLREHYK